jgi:hypothetical protein
MNKPFTVVYEDFKQELANMINNSGLPALVVEFILRDYLNEIRAIAQGQYHSDKAKYEAYLKEKNIGAETTNKDGD